MLFQELLGCVPLSGFAQAGSRLGGHATWKPSLLGTDSRARLPSATMSGCSKRCKLGFVKFAQTIFKLITGTLSKGRKPGLDPHFLSRFDLAAQGASVWQAWPFRCARVSEEAGRNQWLGFGVADNLGPGSEQAGTRPGSSAGSNCLELRKWIWWRVADWLQAGREENPSQIAASC